MTDKVTNINDGREPALPAAESAATVPPEKIAQTAPSLPSEEIVEAKIPADSMVEAELPVEIGRAHV